ncbi:MAG: deoxyribose-phosphate aldolase [candidate division Zixibacteria bacterium]|nr:deoxyribose-phosphate aldolase [candidate division Zixibacteria bacterium]
MLNRALASYIEHTNLAPAARISEIERLCAEAIDNAFAAVCVNPVRVALAASVLSGRPIEVCSVVGFPTGAHTTQAKALEARMAVEAGAGCVDMVANSGLLLDGKTREYANDILSVGNAIGANTTLKVIIEASLLESSAIVEAARLAVEAGANYIKTSTGVYGTARLEDVRLLKSLLPAHVRIKAAGGIRNADFALSLIEAGASRLGTSKSVQILSELPDK